MTSYTLYGALGSPYSIKLRAALRYRRIPFVWRQLESGDESIFGRVKAPVIPVLHYPDGTWKNDSTPVLFDLEQRHTQRSIVPEHAGLAFLTYLLEDFADEWGTKAMFHYQWYRERDQQQMSEWLLFDRLRGAGRDEILRAAKSFRDRQVSRMALVGCTPDNAPVIEESARTILGLFESHVTDTRYLFGSRPSLADFGWLGQLSQLATDPTPQEMMRADFPFTYRWLANLDDASGVEGEWLSPGADLPTAVAGLLRHCGEIYFPFLEANARALESKQSSFALTLLGKTYSQGTFKYQVKCLQELRNAYARLDKAAKEYVDHILSEAGCLDTLISG
jgi:glutathione S-transferase